MADRLIPPAAEALEIARAALADDQAATPGPWSCRDGERQHQANVRDASRTIVAAVYCGGIDAGGRGHAVDNAVLIAAARTREPALAAWVESVLTPPALPDVGADAEEAQRYVSALVEEALDLYEGDPTMCRVLAAALLRAADDAERRRP